SGFFGAELGTTDQYGFLTQNVPTTPGMQYRLSFWLDSSDGLTPNGFSVSWNGVVVLDLLDLPAIGWTNIELRLTATGATSVLQFGFHNDPSFLGLDDISLVPLTFQLTG